MHEAFLSCRAKRQLLVCHRRGRKTSMCLEKMFQYLIKNPGIVGKTLAPIRKQAKENIWKDPDMLFHPNICPPEIIKNKNETDLSIELINGSLWTLDGADDPTTKRGGNVKVLHLTEIGDHKEAIWNQVYEPILEANGGVLLGEGNPRGKNWYYRLFEKATSRPNWERFLISARDTPIFTPEQLRDLESSMPYNVFASEYLCEWVDSVGTVFRNVTECATSEPEEPKPMHEYRFGLDLGKATDFTVLTGIDRHSWNQIFFDRFNMVDWTIIRERVIGSICKYAKRENQNKVEIVVECNGIGDPFFDALVRWYVERGADGNSPSKEYDIMFTPFTTTNASKTALVSNFSMLLDQMIIKILPEPSLLYELGVFTYEKSKTGFFYGAPVGEHDDCVISSLIAYWQLGAKLPKPIIEDEKPKTYFGVKINQNKSGEPNPWIL